ncbi:MAG: ROK family protein [Bacillota bacterium]|nr:ROK family protein [Bacillota bacterium]
MSRSQSDEGAGEGLQGGRAVTCRAEHARGEAAGDIAGSRCASAGPVVADAATGKAAVGVDVGGTKVACGLVDMTGAILERRRVAIDAGDPTGMHPLEQVAAMVRQLADEARDVGLAVAGCGVAVPAVVERSCGRVVWAPNIAGWRDFPLGELLQARTGLPVFVDHDGPAAVMGEQWAGAARGCAHAVLLIIGTGVGAGFILDGRVYRGARGIAGAVGWSCLEPGAVEDPAYREKGFLETVAAGPGIARQVREKVARGERSLALELAGGDIQAITAEVVFAAAEGGDEVARQVIARAVRYIGMAVSNLVSTFNPEVVVLGGGVGRRLGLYLGEVRRIVDATAQPQAAPVARVACAELGDDAGVIGAARMAMEALGLTRPG